MRTAHTLTGGGAIVRGKKKKMTQTPYTVCELYWDHIIHRNCRVKIFDIYKVSEFDIKWYILKSNSSTIFDLLKKKKIWKKIWIKKIWIKKKLNKKNLNKKNLNQKKFELKKNLN